MGKIKIVRKNQNTLFNRSYLDGRVGFWGNVTGIDSTKNRVHVMADIGFEYVGIPVVSHEWVNADDTNGIVSGSRNLPPIGSRVFVFTPTKTITGAFVLCSGYATGDIKTHKIFSDESEKETNNKIKESISPSGWNESEDYSTGIKKLKSKDGNIELTMDPSEAITIKGWKHIIKITENGIVLDNTQTNTNVQITTDKNIQLSGKDVVLDVDNFKIKGGEFALLEVSK